jgi:hypothetical protein
VSFLQETIIFLQDDIHNAKQVSVYRDRDSRTSDMSKVKRLPRMSVKNKFGKSRKSKHDEKRKAMNK